MPDLIEQKESLFDSLENSFVKSVQSLQEDLLSDIEKKLKQFDRKNGRFVGSEKATNLIISLKKDLRKIVEKSDYTSNVDKFLLGFDEIESTVKMIHKNYSDIKFANSLISNEKKALITSVKDNLLNADIDVRFINPVKKMLFSHVTLGTTVIDTEKALRSFVVGERGKHGALEQWAGQVARDSMQQYEGTVNQKIKDEFDLNAIMYVGSIVKDSRSQCKRWLKKEIIFDKDLQKEIDWAKTNGSGFIPGTTVETFCINRGGYNCRHTAIPVRR